MKRGLPKMCELNFTDLTPSQTEELHTLPSPTSQHHEYASLVHTLDGIPGLHPLAKVVAKRHYIDGEGSTEIMEELGMAEHEYVKHLDQVRELAEEHLCR